MSVTNLSGGLTPGDPADPRTFPAIWNAKNIPSFGTATPSDGDALVYDDASDRWVPGEGGGLPSNAYAFVETVYFTSNGTFSKGDYPWLRAIRVACQGAGGGSGGAQATSSGQCSAGGAGGGGGYA